MEVGPHLIWIKLFITGHWNSGNWIGETIPKRSYHSLVNYNRLSWYMQQYIYIYKCANLFQTNAGYLGLANALFIVPSLRGTCSQQILDFHKGLNISEGERLYQPEYTRYIHKNHSICDIHTCIYIHMHRYYNVICTPEYVWSIYIYVYIHIYIYICTTFIQFYTLIQSTAGYSMLLYFTTSNTPRHDGS